MNDLETKLVRDLRTAAADVQVSRDGWQRNQQRIAAAARQTRQRRLLGITAAGVAASLAAVAIGLPGNVVNENRKKTVEVPAGQVPLSRSTLLLPEELWFHGKQSARVGRGEPPRRVSLCQRGTFKELGAHTLWHRIANAEQDDVKVRQAVAQFASREAASKAFTTVNTWFDNCPGTFKEDVKRTAPRDLFGGQVQTYVFDWQSRTDFSKAATESTVVGIHDDAITVVSVLRPGCCDGTTLEEQPADLELTARFAMERLSGRRATTENAVPNDFRFAEEHGPMDRWQNLRDRWYLGTSDCEELTVPGDDLRTGMVTVAPQGLTLQLAVYPDTKTAAAVAEALRAEAARCAAQPGHSVTTVTTSTGREEIYLDFVPENAYGIVSGSSVVQLGRAVFFTDIAPNPEDGASLAARKARALDEVRTSIERNSERICQFSGC